MSQAVYSFGRMKIKDYEQYLKTYGVPFLPILTKYGGKLLAATKNGRVIEGTEEGNWTVLIAFPDGKSAAAFYQSPEYAPLKKLRLETLTDSALAITFPAEIPTE